jgi:hypothetical protein
MAFDVLAFTRQRHVWMVAGVLLALASSAGAVAVAGVQSGREADKARLAVRHSSSDIAFKSTALIGTLGKDLGLATLAEGAETVDQLDRLQAQHVQEAQGFLLSRSLDSDVFETQLLEPTLPPDSPTKGRRRVHR